MVGHSTKGAEVWGLNYSGPGISDVCPVTGRIAFVTKYGGNAKVALSIMQGSYIFKYLQTKGGSGQKRVFLVRFQKTEIG